MTQAGEDRTAALEGGGTVRVAFAFGEAIVHEAEPHRPNEDGPAFNQWPCPGCGSRRPVDDTWRLLISDAPDGEHRRHVMVCALCAAPLRGLGLPEVSLAD